MTEHSLASRRFINVGPDDINEGEPRCNSLCPIARAAMRAFPEAFDVDVAEEDIMIYLSEDWTETQFWTLDERAQKFVKDFDAGKPVEPIMFFSDLSKTIK